MTNKRRRPPVVTGLGGPYRRVWPRLDTPTKAACSDHGIYPPRADGNLQDEVDSVTDDRSTRPATTGHSPRNTTGAESSLIDDARSGGGRNG